MLCKYCSQVAVGINYRPNSSLENVATCKNHATSLFLSFFKADSQIPEKNIITNLQRLLQKLMDSIVAEFNLIKSEVLYHQQQMRKVTQVNAMSYRMNCQITSPYIIIAADEELLLSTLIKRIKFRYEREKVQSQRNSLYNSRISQNESQLLKTYLKPPTSKSYLFFTPQSTDRSKLQSSNVKKTVPTPTISLIADRIKQKLGQKKA